MSDERAHGEVVGSIEPTPTPVRVFTVLSKYEGRANEEKCPHFAYQLDPEWRKVYCARCGDELDPFAVLMQFAEIDKRRVAVEQAEKKMLVQSLRRLRRLRDSTEEEREEIGSVLERHWSAKLDELREIDRRIESAVRERKRLRREARR